MNCFNNSKIFDSLLLKRAIKKGFPDFSVCFHRWIYVILANLQIIMLESTNIKELMYHLEKDWIKWRILQT